MFCVKFLIRMQAQMFAQIHMNSDMQKLATIDLHLEEVICSIHQLSRIFKWGERLESFANFGLN